MSDKRKQCAHPGCQVWIRLDTQPRRYAIGLCVKHEVKALDSSRPGVRKAVVISAPANGSTGVLAMTRVSLAKEPWE